MDRTNAPGHVNHLFVGEDPATNRPPTELTAQDFNAHQEELINIILAAQIAPSAANNAQVLAALQVLFLGKSGGDLTGAITQNFIGKVWEGTPNGGAKVRKFADSVAATTGNIEIGTSYNCDLNPVTGAWAGRDVADICWLEKWSDAGGLKEIWYAPTAAAGAVPVFELIFGIDAVNKLLTGPASLLAHGQCRLVKSGANLVLLPCNGNKLIINGQLQKVPAAGVTVTPASLPAKSAGFSVTNLSAASGTYNITTAAAHNLAVGDTVWLSLYTAPAGTPQLAFNATAASVISGTVFTFVFGTATITTGAATGGGGPLLYHYAYMNAGVMAIESVATMHSTDATTGVEIKTGDATRTLVGMSIGSSFSSQPQSQYVRSWFNRDPLKCYQGLQANRSTASATPVESNASDRCQFLLWANEYIHICAAAPVSGTATGAGAGLTAGFDGSAGVGITSNINLSTIGYYAEVATYPIPLTASEGFHMVSPFIQSSSGTNTFSASGGVSVWS